MIKSAISFIAAFTLGAFTTLNAYADANPEGFQTYKHYNQANSTPKQLLAEDIDRYRNADNL